VEERRERGEAAVGANRALLGESPAAGAVGRPLEPLEIRLYRSRAEYLEDPADGGALPWSSGYYSPNEGISRFYSESGKGAADALGRDLHEVVAHELTHHYVDRRWVPFDARTATQPGFWLVEGFAEHVSEQALEMRRRGGAMDDPTVRALDITAAVARMGRLLPLSTLLSMTHEKFETGLEGAVGVVKLRHTLGAIELDRRGLFYAQSGALTYFVLHRCGDAGRATCLGWLADYYRGRRIVDWSEPLGFNDLAAFEKAFLAFLAGI